MSLDVRFDNFDRSFQNFVCVPKCAQPVGLSLEYVEQRAPSKHQNHETNFDKHLPLRLFEWRPIHSCHLNLSSSFILLSFALRSAARNGCAAKHSTRLCRLNESERSLQALRHVKEKCPGPLRLLRPYLTF